WAKREKQIDRVVLNTVKMYGDMQGIIGASLPELASLELSAGDDEEEGETVKQLLKKSICRVGIKARHLGSYNLSFSGLTGESSFFLDSRWSLPHT
ncbi:MAG: hypothetical protein Q8P48_04025, partial [Deltaproteobacteria bacterium]|nr:hypothetical protein [Deltaproteobacteria bacterium]